ncbi:MAG: hypothetical protein DRQ40_01940 [Gammaproteobacteria bacterium]|nr:MAG: hypothetical protein DRQ40_01940 [Gammaproteobacteria bacterium]RLA02038.1 MAG: hypothetical protein DRQ42_01705 [Gammaproteobacteria bacterium]HHA19396.1 LamB/YcsF family protein [Methylophaga sp.]
MYDKKLYPTILNFINIVFMKQINCDLGECLIPDPDGVIMPLIDMANIACGGHVGDEESMTIAIKLAKQNGVQIGAHPSYPDKDNFGRISHSISSDELFQHIFEQVVYFQSLCKQQGVELQYIKPHGALYHDMMNDAEVLDVLCNVIHNVESTLSLVVHAGINTELFESVSKDSGIQFFYEAFADRAYRGFQMIPRGEQGAVLDDVQAIVDQYHYFSTDRSNHIDIICFHSDNPSSTLALTMLKAK